ncbi:hypothetical protein [Vulcanococcus limneticus]|uniref:hypothetical protein n=1 Tax=Vulcanococcus limneticus TaxID=2170428 RepID=UPI00398BEB88
MATPPPRQDDGVTVDSSLLQWLQHHPRFQHLLADSPPTPPLPRWRRWLQRALNAVQASPEDFRGTAHVSAETQRDSELVARMVTTSNWIDGVGNFGLFLFAAGAGTPLGWITASGMTALLLKFDQEVCTTVARGRRGGRRIAYTAAVIGLLPLSLIKSFGTGVGVEVFQNRPQLQQRQAAVLVDRSLAERRALLQRQQQADPTYAGVRQQCQQGQAALARLPHADPRWQSLQVELYGEWSQRRSDWRRSGRQGQLPVCVQQKLLEEEQRDRSAVARQQVEALEQQRIQLGNDQAFLRRHFPARYALTFSGDGEFRSPVELVAVAMQNFLGKLASRDWAELGLPLFVLSFSLLTSATTCALVLLHPFRHGVAMSWSEDVRRERDRWLAEQLNALEDRP